MQAVEVVENLWIELGDGTRLAARMWRPREAVEKLPAILEYIPYRKRDGTRGRDEPMHGWFAAQGYVAVRVDTRGSGESEGDLADEYLQQELNDACEVIDWLCRQSWCNGRVGMMGKSWGGFNALQTAALRPPSLKAIIAVCSTDDRYADDIHYMGGALLNDNLWWGAIMLSYQARPPDPALVGEGWRATWLERIDRMPLWPALWLRHQRRDAYWRHGSICEDFSAIACPVFAVGGWSDAYTNAIPRLLAGLKTPRLGLIGPWAHLYPHDGKPGPALDFLGESLRWWDHWLKDRDTGIMNEPMLRAFIENGGSPENRDIAAGRFVAETAWPSPNILPRIFAVSEAGLVVDTGDRFGPPTPLRPTLSRPSTSASERSGSEIGRKQRRVDGRGKPGHDGESDAMNTESAILAPMPVIGEVQLCSPCWTGAGVGEWMGTGVEGEGPTDQRFDDGFSRVFDSVPLTERLELLGAPEFEIEIASDKRNAQFCARLCDVAPDGASRRVSYGVLNLTHRESHAEPTALTPGAFYTIRLKLNDCGYVFAPGHVVRLALASAYWPLLWPAPERATLTLRLPGRLTLPVRAFDAPEPEVRFAPPQREAGPATTRLSEGRMTRTTSFDLMTGVSTYVTHSEGGLFGEGAYRFDEIDTAIAHDLKRELSIGAEDPLSARYGLTQSYEMGREGWRIRIETEVSMHATQNAFLLSATLRAYENGVLARRREFSEVIARDGV